MSQQYASEAVVIDGVLREWGDRIGYGSKQGRKAVPTAKVRKNAFGGQARQAHMPSRQPASLRDTFQRVIRKSPEVMVKVKPGGMSMQGIKRRMNYIGRSGAVELEDQTGERSAGQSEINALMDDWRGYGIPDKNGRRREALHIILSMPPGTDRTGVEEAARRFAAEEFKHHKYAFAMHNDEAHPHVHLIVKMMNESGTRLNPRKAQLQQWREHFAERLRDEGIDANATPRRARGVVHRHEQQAVLQIDRKHREGKITQPSILTQRRKALAEAELRGHGQPLTQPGTERAKKTRIEVIRLMGETAKALSKGSPSEQELALQAVAFVQTLPAAHSKHELLVNNMRAHHKQGGREGDCRSGSALLDGAVINMYNHNAIRQLGG